MEEAHSSMTSSELMDKVISTPKTGKKELDYKIEEWLDWDKNNQTKNEINKLVEKCNVKELEKRLMSRMEFGTAGLRSQMGAGYTMMNDLTIIQTSQGFAKYALKVTPTLEQRGIVIGYDARHNSQRWARIAATVFINLNIPVHLFSEICPTPYVAYGVLQLQCDWGLMITASHNPKEDNGYKVYYKNGAQIIPPHDKGIAEEILANLKPLESSWNICILEDSELLSDPRERVRLNYRRDMRSTLSRSKETNANTKLKFTYTAMHGVGYKAIKEAFRIFKFPPVIPVTEQVEPDPDFPTVKFPNPEEGKSALDLAIKTANENGSTVILANDPDADRLAVAEKQPDDRWHCFSGNELGALLLWWMIYTYKEKNPTSSGDQVFCLASTVSSKILRTIAKKEGFHFEETLTGFKWMGNRAQQLMDEGKTVLFAFEEAIGFMCGSKVLDKDGISAAVVCAEMATYLAEKDKTIMDQLNWIYANYGLHVTNNSYYICNDKEKQEGIFRRLRNFNGKGKFPYSAFANPHIFHRYKYPTKCGPYQIKYVRDLTTGFDSSRHNKKAGLPTSASSQMITFTFENGCVMTLRTSGTEPKIKYYSELILDPSEKLTHAEATDHLEQIVFYMVEEFLQPIKNGLITRGT